MNDQEREGLLELRSIMADPDKVVLNADDLWENAQGESVYGYDPRVATRGCLIAWYFQFRDEGKTLPSFARFAEAVKTVGIPYGKSGNTFTETIREGRQLEVIDAVLAQG